MAVQPNYRPAPTDLSRLNPIQRYMQKGELDYSDYLRLIAIVLAYWFLRPYLQKLFKKLAGSDYEEGEEETLSYQKRRVKAAIGANEIRGAKEKPQDQVIGDLLDSGVAASGTEVAEKPEGASKVTNRKKGVTFAPDKTTEEQLVDWDDEPSRQSVEGDKGDVMKWLDRWDKEEI